MTDKPELPSAVIMPSGFEFQCEECGEFTSVGDTKPPEGNTVKCKKCGQKHLVSW